MRCDTYGCDHLWLWLPMAVITYGCITYGCDTYAVISILLACFVFGV